MFARIARSAAGFTAAAGLTVGGVVWCAPSRQDDTGSTAASGQRAAAASTMSHNSEQRRPQQQRLHPTAWLHRPRRVLTTRWPVSDTKIATDVTLTDGPHGHGTRGADVGHRRTEVGHGAPQSGARRNGSGADVGHAAVSEPDVILDPRFNGVWKLVRRPTVLRIAHELCAGAVLRCLPCCCIQRRPSLTDATRAVL